MHTLVDRGGNCWTVREHEGQLAYEVAGRIAAPRPLDVLSDRELVELVRAELEP